MDWPNAVRRQRRIAVVCSQLFAWPPARAPDKEGAEFGEAAVMILIAAERAQPDGSPIQRRRREVGSCRPDRTVTSSDDGRLPGGIRLAPDGKRATAMMAAAPTATASHRRKTADARVRGWLASHVGIRQERYRGTPTNRASSTMPATWTRIGKPR